jgi:hypothetical protein
MGGHGAPAHHDPRSIRGHVWTTYGGWFADPKAWRRNTFAGFVALGALGFVTWNFSRKNEVRWCFRSRWRSRSRVARVYPGG